MDERTFPSPFKLSPSPRKPPPPSFHPPHPPFLPPFPSLLRPFLQANEKKHESKRGVCSQQQQRKTRQHIGFHAARKRLKIVLAKVNSRHGGGGWQQRTQKNATKGHTLLQTLGGFPHGGFFSMGYTILFPTAAVGLFDEHKTQRLLFMINPHAFISRCMSDLCCQPDFPNYDEKTPQNQ